MGNEEHNKDLMGGEECGASALKLVGWTAALAGVVALGVVVGREIRARYKFNRRTPYDFFSHSGDGVASDQPMGI